MDYEFRGVSDVDSDYDAIARDFARPRRPNFRPDSTLAASSSGSSEFSAGVQSRDDFAVPAILGRAPVRRPRLGADIARLPHRSLGTSTRRLLILRKDDGMGLAFGRRANAWTPLGPPLPEVAAAPAFRVECTILAGIHDSNASYLAHRATREQPFCVVSTGTWIVVMATWQPPRRAARRTGHAGERRCVRQPGPYRAIYGRTRIRGDLRRRRSCAAVGRRPGECPRVGGVGDSIVRGPGRAISRAGRATSLAIRRVRVIAPRSRLSIAR